MQIALILREEAEALRLKKIFQDYLKLIQLNKWEFLKVLFNVYLLVLTKSFNCFNRRKNYKINKNKIMENLKNDVENLAK